MEPVANSAEAAGDASPRLREASAGDVRRAEAVHSMLTELLRAGQAVLFDTFGLSMRPLIKPGSILRVRGCPIDRVRRGDVVMVYSRECRHGKYLVHRVIAAEGRGAGRRLRTKGDSSPCDLEHFTSETLMGKVESVWTGDRVCDLRKVAWRVLDPLVGSLSGLDAWATHRRVERGGEPRRRAFPESVAVFFLRMLVYLGKALSTHPAEPPGKEGSGSLPCPMY